jgi:hypothetical protein
MGWLYDKPGMRHHEGYLALRRGAENPEHLGARRCAGVLRLRVERNLVTSSRGYHLDRLGA